MPRSTLPSSSPSLREVHGVGTQLVTPSLAHEIPRRLHCSPAATPQGHRAGNNLTSSDVDFGESLTQEGTKEKRCDIP